MNYTLSWWERVDDKWVRQCRHVSEQEFQEIKNTKIVKGFKDGSIICHVQLIENMPAEPYKPELKKIKQKQNKPYYRTERW